MQSPATTKRKNLLSHLLTSVLYTVVTVVVLGIIYPLALTAIGSLIFPHQALSLIHI